ncbi:outer membrane protein transport protein [Thalassobacter stenotrophicus]|uniref:OmpP1/FadL family transporter n=1 Tax=Thalassobacter stenotrophicus TaxID=266809 RepID=UPI0022A8F0EB|nr:outer membrane protein transport protein [Thalassobacter stenotrophicus]UYP69162.1 outer membrane protein transport protein [Thalassobacter stenotrophicus]
MKLKITTSAAILGALTSPAWAGSLERNSMPIDLMFYSGSIVQFSYTAPSPDMSAAPFGGTGSAFNDFSTAGFAFKTDLNDNLSVGLFFNQPFGADNGYIDGPLAGYSIDLQTNEIAAVLNYQLSSNLSVHGGLRAVQSQVDLNITPALGYSLDTERDTGFGYLLGASYVVPERGARVTLTYQSSVQHSFNSVEDTTGVGGGILSTTTEAELPQSIKLDGEIALSSNTLLFGGIKWSDYSGFDVAAPGIRGVLGRSIIDYQEDNINLSLGLGHSINDEWSVFGILDNQLSDGEQTSLRPYDGSRALTVGAIYESGQYKVTAGAQYREFGDTTVTEALLGGATASFEGNTAISPFFSVAYSF